MSARSEATEIAMDVLDLVSGTQPRAEKNEEVVAEYAQALEEGAIFPPVIVFHDGTTYWLADGFHRVAAHRKAGRTRILAEVCMGNLRDAILYAVGANAKHGLQRSNSDKRRAVERLLRDEEWSKWSDREIAKRCAVSQPFVGKVRAILTDNVISENGESERVYTTKHGTTATMDTTNIGKRPLGSEFPNLDKDEAVEDGCQPTEPPAPAEQHEAAPPPEEGPYTFEDYVKSGACERDLADGERRRAEEAAATSAPVPTPAPTPDATDPYEKVAIHGTGKDGKPFITYQWRKRKPQPEPTVPEAVSEKVSPPAPEPPPAAPAPTPEEEDDVPYTPEEEREQILVAAEFALIDQRNAIEKAKRDLEQQEKSFKMARSMVRYHRLFGGEEEAVPAVEVKVDPTEPDEMEVVIEVQEWKSK